LLEIVPLEKLVSEPAKIMLMGDTDIPWFHARHKWLREVTTASRIFLPVRFSLHNGQISFINQKEDLRLVLEVV